MKNFKKVVFGLLAMLVMVTGVSATATVDNATRYEENDITDEAVLRTCAAKTVNTVICSLQKDVTLAHNIIVDGKNVTINLNGHKVTAGGAGIIVNANASLILNGGEIDYTNGYNTISGNLTVNGTKFVAKNAPQVFNVTGVANGTFEENHTTVVFNNVTVTNEGGMGVKFNNDNTAITMDGTWNTTSSVVQVNGPAKVKFVGGAYRSTTASVLAVGDASAEITIEKGTYTADNNITINQLAGKLTINGGDFTAKADDSAVINFEGSNDLTITNGNFTAGKANALVTKTTGKLNISGGLFTIAKGAGKAVVVYNTNKPSNKNVTGGQYVNGTTNTDSVLNLLAGKNADGKQLKAVRIGDVVYIGLTHKLIIEVNNENGVVNKWVSPQDALLAGHEYKFADDNVKAFLDVKANEGYVVKYVLVTGDKEEIVTADGFVMPDEDATLKVSFVKPEELNKPADEQQPSDTPSSGANDGEETNTNENTNTNPSTFDGIASIVTMAVSSLGAAGYSIKKIIRK